MVENKFESLESPLCLGKNVCFYSSEPDRTNDDFSITVSGTGINFTFLKGELWS